MSQSNKHKGDGVGHLIKALAIAFLKLLAIAAGFIFKVLSAVFAGLASLMEKLSGHGSGH